MLTYKCVLAGKVLVQISERDTSKTCSGCGHKQDMPLYKRTYRCGNCGLVMDRDENSAVNIRERFLARLGPHTRRKRVRCAASAGGGVAVKGPPKPSRCRNRHVRTR
jgi:transposase